MMTKMSVATLLLTALLCFLAGVRPRTMEISDSFKRKQRYAACALLLLGCFARLYRLTSVPAGLSAEEALVGVQARAWLATGRQAFGGALSTYLPQWGASQTGTLLVALSAPFVGILGMNLLAVRLPLALLSCLSLAALYGFARRASGERTGLYTLLLASVNPYFIQQSHWALSASTALFLLPIVLYAGARALKSAPWSYLFCALAGLCVYALDMAAPALLAFTIAFLALAAARALLRPRDALLSGLLFLCLSLPALLTLLINALALPGFSLGVLEVARFEPFEHSAAALPADYADWVNAGYSVVCGSLFEQAFSENLTASGFVKPDGYGMAYFVLAPLVCMGCIPVFTRRALCAPDACRRTMRQSVAVLALTLIFYLLLQPESDIFHYALLLPLLLLIAGYGLSEVHSRLPTCCLAFCLMLAMNFSSFFFSFYIQGVPLETANTFFSGLGEAAVFVKHYEQQRGEGEIYMTTRIYPHENPRQAAEMLTAFAFDLPAEFLLTPAYASRFHYGAPQHVKAMPGRCYILRLEELQEIETDAFDVAEFGDFCVLTPSVSDTHP